MKHFALPLAVVAALFALPGHAAPARMLFADFERLDPEPDSAFARTLAAHRAEAAHRPAQHAPTLRRPTFLDVDPAFAWSAANFAALGKPKWEITHQDITVDLVAASSELKVTIVATVRPHQPTDLLTLVTMGVSAIKAEAQDGTAIKVSLNKMGGYSGLSIGLPAPLTPEVDWKLTTTATAKLNCNPQGIGLLPCGVGGTYQWVTFHQYYLTPANIHSPFKSTLHVITAANKVAGAQGIPMGSDTLADGRKVWHFEQPERTENAGFAVAEYVQATGKLVQDKPLRVFTTSKYASSVKNMVDLATKVVGVYSTDFGDFPWPGLNLMQLENNFGGGYAPLSGIFMYRDVYAASPGTGYWYSTTELVAHEIGHQWWGNLVEPATSGDVALSESLAEFSSCLYTEKYMETRSQIIRDSLSYLYRVPANEDVAVGAQGVYSSPSYVEIVYHKGAAVFEMLRNEIGTETVLKALKQFAVEYNRDYATLGQLQAVTQNVAKKDLSWFWNQWFDKKGAIQAEVAGRLGVAADGGYLVRLRFNQIMPKPFRFTVPITVDYAAQKSEVKLIEVNPKGEPITVVEFAVSARPIRVRLDVQRSVIRKFATGTPGDFNLSGQVDGADLVELALRYGRAMRIKAKNGQEYFFSDSGWNELYDLKPDRRIDMADVDALDEWIGTLAEEF